MPGLTKVYDGRSAAAVAARVRATSLVKSELDPHVVIDGLETSAAVFAGPNVCEAMPTNARGIVADPDVSPRVPHCANGFEGDLADRPRTVVGAKVAGALINTETMLIGGIPTLRTSRKELAERMVADCALARSGRMPRPRVLTSSNGSVIARFRRDAAFRELIMKADSVDADGQPLVIASRLRSKTPLMERIATTDFIHDAAAAAADNGLRFYFLGAKPGVAQVAADHLGGLYPGLQVVGVRDGYFDLSEEDQICRDIAGLDVDVLWVGLGSPMQESFAIRNRDKLVGLAWIKTCGGLFDHYSGKITRAPLWMQRAGLEWLYRMVKEPRRLGPRYLMTNLPALYHLVTATSDIVDSSPLGHTPAA